MHYLEFKYKGERFHLDMGTQTLKNVSTGEICKVHQLRDFGLIAKVNQCMSDALSEKYYGMVIDLMIANINVGDHENGPKNNHGGAVNDAGIRKNNRCGDTVFPRDGHSEDIS